MKSNNTTFLQRIMEEMDSEHLNEMLQEELHRDVPDGDAVRTALKVLEGREKNCPGECCQDIQEAWEKYQVESKITEPTPLRRKCPLLKVASIVLVLIVALSAVPQTVQAKGLFDRIVQWTDSFFEMLRTEDQKDQNAEYVFKTDNPGLQQVYDAVVELGVTEPVVPMWMPEHYQLTRITTNDAVDWVLFSAFFGDSEKNAVIQIRILSENIPSSYYKDSRLVEPYEANGMGFNIMRNNAQWAVVYVRDNIECSITLDCQEEELYRLLDSIYSMEDK